MSYSIGWIITLTSVFLISSLATVSYSVCPVVCTCKWKSGKETVECVNRDLTSLPIGIKSGAQVLDLSKNNLRTLPSRVFFESDLTNLQKIYMSDCRLTNIADDAFYQVTNLIELDLKKNILMEVPAESFSDCRLLRRLILSGNPIQRLRNDTFLSLPELRFLELSECKITVIELEAFKGLGNLETLKLDGNDITTLSHEMVRPLKAIYELHLHNNPWYCDCRLRDIREWFTRKNVPFIIPPKCDAPPHVSGRTWDILQPDDFSCEPSVFSEDSVIVQRFQNGTLECEVESKPEAEVTWIFNEINLNNGSEVWEEKYWLGNEYRGKVMVSVLTVVRATEEDSGVYSCIASNPAGSTSRNISFSVVFQEPLSVGWSKAQIAGIIVGVLVFLVLMIVLIGIVIVRKRALSSSESKLGGANFLKHLAYAKQNSVEVKSDKEVPISDKSTRRETGSSGYGSDQQTPDLVSRAMDTEPPYISAPKPLNGLDNCSWNTGQQNQEWFKERAGRFMSASPSYVPRYINNVDYNDRGNSADTDSFRDESYHSYTSPAHTNWKRSPLVLPNNAYLSLSHDTCCSPDEGYDEGALEGTEV